MVRDPPRKSEQACRAVRCSRGQRGQPRRPSKCGTACIERRQRNGRRQRHCLRIHSTQRKWQRRVLGNAEPCPGDRERCQVRGIDRRRRRLPDFRHGKRSHTSNGGRTEELQLRETWCNFGIDEVGSDCNPMWKRSQSLGNFELYMYGNMKRQILTTNGEWLIREEKECNGWFGWIRYLFNSSGWITGVRYLLLTHGPNARCRMQYNVGKSMIRCVIDGPKMVQYL